MSDLKIQTKVRPPIDEHITPAIFGSRIDLFLGAIDYGPGSTVKASDYVFFKRD